MKYIWSLLLLGGMSCSEHEGWILEGKTSSLQYDYVYLLDEEENVMDSVLVQDGTFHLELLGKVQEPYPVVLRFMDETGYYLDMPAFVENGNVDLSIDEYIHIGGTPLNNAMQDFLNGLQDCKDNCFRQAVKIGEEDIARMFSTFYLQQIAIHRHNVLGEYIFRHYGIHLNKEDEKKAKELLHVK